MMSERDGRERERQREREKGRERDRERGDGCIKHAHHNFVTFACPHRRELVLLFGLGIADDAVVDAGGSGGARALRRDAAAKEGSLSCVWVHVCVGSRACECMRVWVSLRVRVPEPA
eukprot:2764905-Pleurochrysis_carterae.AAC.1